MNIHEKLTEAHSRQISEQIKTYVGDDSVRFEQLLECFASRDAKVAQRAAMAVGKCLDVNPQLGRPYMGTMIEHLKAPKHDAIARAVVRWLQTEDVPSELMGELAEICFELASSMQTPIAIKVFAMTVLANICEKEPVLASELKAIIEYQMPFGSAGFRSRGGKILKRLDQLIG